MYVLVSEQEAKRYRRDCSNILKRACQLLKKKGITAQYSLIGSGAKNLITKNGNAPYDLDYNLEIITATNEYWNDLKYLKDVVRVCLDEASELECFEESHDSTSCLTAILYFNNSPDIEFSFDVGIVARNKNGNLMRLVHNKIIWRYGNDQYTWNEVPNSRCIKEKADTLKYEGLWNEVRNSYLNKKNMYLQRGDTSHPSFIIYVETVNEVYSRYFR